MANTEDIEARLCAYIDGQLDAREREDIERHLASHPQHHELLGELMRQRDLVRRLPRESASDDLYENITGHLERSILLDSDPHEHSVAAAATNRWSQVYAAAAVLLLAVGLAAVIFFVLPRHSFEDENLALAPATTHPVNLSTAGVSAPGSAGIGAVAGRDVFARRPATTQHENRDIFAMANSSQPADALPRKSEDLLAGPRQSGLIQVPKPLNPLVLVVNARDPAAARSQVMQFLQENQLSWRHLDESSPEAQSLRDEQSAQMDRLAQVRVALKQPVSALPTTLPGEPRPKEALPGVVASSQRAIESSATTQSLAFDSSELPQAQSSPAPQEIYLVRDLTSAQVADLKACVATLEPSARPVAKTISLGHGIQMATAPSISANEPPAVMPPATQPTSQPAPAHAEELKTGDLLSIADSRSDQVSLQSIDADGRITIPGLGRIVIAGLSIGQASSNISNALRAAGTRPATVTLRIIRPAATQPVIPDEEGAAAAKPTVSSKQTPTSRPVVMSTQPLPTTAEAAEKSLADGESRATTQPLIPATQPAGPRTNVVIVFQPGISPPQPFPALHPGESRGEGERSMPIPRTSAGITEPIILSAPPETQPATTPSP